MSTEVTLPEVDETLTGTEDQVEPTDEVTLPTSEENETSEATEEVEPEVKKPTGFQKRVQKFQAQLTAKEQELEYWKNVALQKAPAQEVSQEKPKLADFDSVEDYVEAREEFLKRELLEQVTRQAAQTTRQNTAVATYEAKVREAQAALPDWEEVMEAAAEEPTAPETVQFCLDSDIGPKIAYHLAKHPEEHDRINGMSPMRRVAELGKLEERLKAPAAAKAVTKAPAKLSDVKGTAAAVIKHPGEATSFAEWKKLDAARRSKK